MQTLWDFSFKYLFSEKTNLFYDHISELSENGVTNVLPSLDEIKNQQPNPNGWSTGMEDSVLTGSLMLDAIISRYKIQPSAELISEAHKVFKGLKLCATVSNDKGFVARSVSPIDCVSHYINSSRDQYTHLIYSFTRYYNSVISNNDEKSDIRSIFVDIAKRLEKYVTPENDYQFPREDGKTGLCMKMWGDIGKHEYLRLPMFYAAAYFIGGDEHFEDLYLKYRDEAIEKSHGICYEELDTAYPILQMQYSLKFICEFDNDPEIQNKCKALMAEAAKAFYVKAKEKYRDLLNCTDTINYRYRRWNEVPAVYIGVIGDLPYNNHNQDIYLENRAYYIYRNIADSVSICALTGNYSMELEVLIKSAADKIDINNHYSNAPLYLLGGYWSMCELA